MYCHPQSVKLCFEQIQTAQPHLEKGALVTVDLANQRVRLLPI